MKTFTLGSLSKLALLTCAVTVASACSKSSSSPAPASSTPTPTASPAAAAPAQIVTQGNAGPLTTVILNKTDAVSPYVKTSLILNLGLTGSPSPSTPTDLIFQCKRESDTTFHPCPNGATYDFGTLVDGQSVSLAVEAILPAENLTAVADQVSFTVHLNPTALNVVNGLALASQKTGMVQLSWDPTQVPNGSTVNCAIDNAPAANCTAGLPLNISSMPVGAHTVVITAVNASGGPIGTDTIPFCSQSCPTGSITGGAAPVQGNPEIYGIGGYYQYLVPPDSHVTEYTADNTSEGLAFYRVTPQTDPTYLGNYACDGKFDSQMSQVAQDGTPFDYCLLTPPNPDFVTWLTNYRISRNHLEVETNPALDTDENHLIVDFNLFDGTYPYAPGRSRFEQLCAQRNGAIYVANGVTYLNPTFWGNQLVATLYMCTADLVVPTGSGLPMRDPTMWRNTWWIGAFFIGKSSTAIPNPACIGGNTSTNFADINGSLGSGTSSYAPTTLPAGCASYTSPTMLEITFTSKTPYPTPQAFGYDVEQNLTHFLQETQPISVN